MEKIVISPGGAARPLQIFNSNNRVSSKRFNRAREEDNMRVVENGSMESKLQVSY
jgi:hypothetical protein